MSESSIKNASFQTIFQICVDHFFRSTEKNVYKMSLLSTFWKCWVWAKSKTTNDEKKRDKKQNHQQWKNRTKSKTTTDSPFLANKTDETNNTLQVGFLFFSMGMASTISSSLAIKIDFCVAFYLRLFSWTCLTRALLNLSALYLSVLDLRSLCLHIIIYLSNLYLSLPCGFFGFLSIPFCFFWNLNLYLCTSDAFWTVQKIQ